MYSYSSYTCYPLNPNICDSVDRTIYSDFHISFIKSVPNVINIINITGDRNTQLPMKLILFRILATCLLVFIYISLSLDGCDPKSGTSPNTPKPVTHIKKRNPAMNMNIVCMLNNPQNPR